MTTLVAWIAVDSRGPSSLYLASDSRLSWDRNTGDRDIWDHGQKVFACQKSPDVFGYVGDVTFPAQCISQICAALDLGLVVAPGASPSERFAAIASRVKEAFDAYPTAQSRAFGILHGTRAGELLGTCEFALSEIDWDPATGWSERVIDLSPHSKEIALRGTGSVVAMKWKGIWDVTSEASTSRAVFGAICDAIASAEDPCSGGAPQLVGLIRKGPAQILGVVYAGKPYLLGQAVDPGLVSPTVRWHNHLFERCDPTGATLPSAKSHYAPWGLGRAGDT